MAFKGPNSGASGGSGTPITFTHNPIVDAIGAISIHVRVKIGNSAQFLANGIDSAWIGKGDSGGTSGWAFYTSGTVDIEFDALSWGTAGGFWGWALPFTDTQWHSYLVTYAYSSTADNAVLYADGALQPSYSFADAPSGARGATDTNNILVGDYQYQARGWQGSLAHVAVWNSILTPLEALLVASGVPPPLIRPDALVFYCPCAGDPKQALDLGRAQLGLGTPTGAWLPADDPFGLMAVSRTESPVPLSPAFQPFPYRRPNLPLYRR
jgi:hypothetical protein